jgi:membrane protein YdbS with pleckstrin-like domain
MTDETKPTAVSGGGGIATLLTVLFIGLKLGGVIAWSWWWVLSPLWLPAAVVLVVFVVATLSLWIGRMLYDAVRERDAGE